MLKLLPRYEVCRYEIRTWGLTFHMIEKLLHSFLTLHLHHPKDCTLYANQVVVIFEFMVSYTGTLLRGDKVMQKEVHAL